MMLECPAQSRVRAGGIQQCLCDPTLPFRTEPDDPGVLVGLEDGIVAALVTQSVRFPMGDHRLFPHT